MGDAAAISAQPLPTREHGPTGKLNVKLLCGVKGVSSSGGHGPERRRCVNPAARAARLRPPKPPRNQLYQRVQRDNPPGKIDHAAILTARRASASHDTPQTPLQY